MNNAFCEKKLGDILPGDGKVHAVFEESVSLPRRPEYSHKGTFGKVLIIGGSVGYTGAPVMAAKSAQRGGAGLVFLGVPESIYPICAAKLDEPMAFPLQGKDGALGLDALPELEKRLSGMSAVLIGPGLGREEETAEAVRQLYNKIAVPLILDADGINAFEGHTDKLDGHGRVLILTPHEGEFERLGGDMSKDRLAAARRFAKERCCVLVLKGHRTITAFPDGETYVNTSGNSGLAKGGSGDVLAGLIVSFMAQGIDIKEAVPAASYICGAAADTLAEKITEYCLLPTDVINAFPEVIKKLIRE